MADSERLIWSGVQDMLSAILTPAKAGFFVFVTWPQG